MRLYEKNGQIWSDRSHHPLKSIYTFVPDVNDPDVKVPVVTSGCIIDYMNNTVSYHDDRCSLKKTIKDFYGQSLLGLWIACSLAGYQYSELGRLILKQVPGAFSEPKKISRYVRCEREMPRNAVAAASRILNFDADKLTEIFTPPPVRGIGDFWVGTLGSVVQDYGDRNLDLSSENMFEQCPSLEDEMDDSFTFICDAMSESDVFNAIKASTDYLYGTDLKHNDNLTSIVQAH